MKHTVLVAIGSSAGGLEALKPFFDATPHDGVAYILLRHLPLDYQSILAEILSRHSRLVFMEAADGMHIEKDKVYLPPSAMYMTVTNNRLHLQERVVTSLYPNWSVDVFLESLAKDKGKNGIAVILSGSGSDGSKGASSVKLAGGLVIAQTPSSCLFPSMPTHAIATGDVDHVLFPSEMSKTIRQYADSIFNT
jgi:chemotaxis response regulator CheB